MPKKLALTLACGDYEIVRPLLNGKVEVDGVDLTILTDMDSATRHWRFLNGGEFDVAELSSSSYLAARDNDLPFRAIPVFLHRRFRHGFMFINTSKGISKPADLKGPQDRREDDDDSRPCCGCAASFRANTACRWEQHRVGCRNRGRHQRSPCRPISGIPACAE